MNSKILACIWLISVTFSLSTESQDSLNFLELSQEGPSGAEVLFGSSNELFTDSQTLFNQALGVGLGSVLDLSKKWGDLSLELLTTATNDYNLLLDLSTNFQKNFNTEFVKFSTNSQTNFNKIIDSLSDPSNPNPLDAVQTGLNTFLTDTTAEINNLNGLITNLVNQFVAASETIFADTTQVLSDFTNVSGETAQEFAQAFTALVPGEEKVFEDFAGIGIGASQLTVETLTGVGQLVSEVTNLALTPSPQSSAPGGA